MTFQPKPFAVIVQQGKVLDYIDGETQREETPEEYVRQEIAKSLVREYGYPKKHIAVEFTLRVGSRKPRADIVIFREDVSRTQEVAYLIVECKAKTVKSNDRNEGVGQLQSYLSVCPNSVYGMWTNGIERFCYRKILKNQQIHFEEVPDLPFFGQTGDEAERPRFDQLKPATSDALLHCDLLTEHSMRWLRRDSAWFRDRGHQFRCKQRQGDRPRDDRKIS